MIMQLPFIFARRFVAGETLAEALAVVGRLNDRGLHVTLDLLGEYVTDRRIAEEAAKTFLHLIHVVANERDRGGPDAANISLKLSMLGQKVDEGLCRDHLHELLEAASEKDVFIRLDMEGSDLTESTLGVFEDVYPQYPNHVGIVLQAYLKRTLVDVQRMCELKARVRMCKGAYKEPPAIAYQQMDVIRERFIEYSKILMEESRHPGIATHDAQIIEAIKTYVRDRGISRDRFEFQMLYGMRPETQMQLVNEGYHVRVYVPYGSEWFPYFFRRLRERKENVWFVVENLFKR